jgi:hypothetical protein
VNHPYFAPHPATDFAICSAASDAIAMSERKTVSKTLTTRSVKKSVVISVPKAARAGRDGNDPSKENQDAGSRSDEGTRRTNGAAFVRHAILHGLDNGRVRVGRSHGKADAKRASYPELPARTEAQDRQSRGNRLPPSARGSVGVLTEPDLNSVHRVGNDMLEAKKALVEVDRLAVDPDLRRAYAEEKVEASPGARERVEREAAKGVDFADGEVLFRDLQALDISAREMARLRPPPPASRTEATGLRRQRVRAPTIEDFHEPFRGEERLAGPADHDPDEVFRELEEARRERRGGRRNNGNDSAAVERDHEYFAKLKEWGLL